jgi:hypothetical protein
MFVIELSVHPERHLVQRLKALAIGADRQLVENGLQFAECGANNAPPTCCPTRVQKPRTILHLF